MPTNTYNSNQTVGAQVAAAGVTITDIVTNNIGTPVGQLPTVFLNVSAALLGHFKVEAENGAVANVTQTLGALGTFLYTADSGTINLGVTLVGVVSNTTINLSNGGTVSETGAFVSALSGTDTINFQAGDSTLNTDSDGTFIGILNPTALITGFTGGDTINDGDVQYSAITSYNVTENADETTQTVTFFTGGTSEGSLTFTDGTFSADGTGFIPGGGPVHIVSGPGGVTTIEGCFLRGTHIGVANGEACVEDLRIGDMVVTQECGKSTLRPVTWIGIRSVRVANGGNGFPIRIRASAFAENTPHRDLLVTPEHCIFVEGALIPARMLVNGASILIDREVSNYTYYHVELENHAILLSEGLASESYLDTGNRGNFANAPTPSFCPDFTLTPAHKSWELDAAAPLATDAETVEPIWRRLADRSVALEKPIQDFGTTEDAGLCIRARGQIRQPIYNENGLAVFALPRGATDAQIVSRSSAPADARPWLNDRRRLGVNVKRIILRGTNDVIEIPVDSPSLTEGWWDVEGDVAASHRWTNGAATLSFPRLPKSGMFLLELHLDGDMTYVTDAQQNRRAA